MHSFQFVNPKLFPPESACEGVAEDPFNYYTAQVVNAVVSLIKVFGDVSACVLVDVRTVQVEPGFKRILSLTYVLSTLALSTIQQVNNT